MKELCRICAKKPLMEVANNLEPVYSTALHGEVRIAAWKLEELRVHNKALLEFFSERAQVREEWLTLEKLDMLINCKDLRYQYHLVNERERWEERYYKAAKEAQASAKRVAHLEALLKGKL